MNSLEFENAEEKLLIMAMPHIKKLCYGKWKNLEPEDRVSEALLFFVCAYRSLPINTGHFMSDYVTALTPYMNERNSETPSRYYGRAPSLDQKHDDSRWSLYEVFQGSVIDETVLPVASFLGSLPARSQSIIDDLMDEDLSREEIAQKYGLPAYAFNGLLETILDDYIQSNWIDR